MIPRCGVDDCPNARMPGAVHCQTHSFVRRSGEEVRRVIGGDAGPHIVGASIERVTDEDGESWRLP